MVVVVIMLAVVVVVVMTVGILLSRKTMKLRSRCLFWYSVGCGWSVR